MDGCLTEPVGAAECRFFGGGQGGWPRTLPDDTTPALPAALVGTTVVMKPRSISTQTYTPVSQESRLNQGGLHPAGWTMGSADSLSLGTWHAGHGSADRAQEVVVGSLGGSSTEHVLRES